MATTRTIPGKILLARAARYLRAPMLLSWLVLAVPAVWSAEATVGVVYPEIREPYRSIFLAIVNGIEDGIGGPLRRLALDAEATVSTLTEWAEDEQVGVIVALGQRAHDKVRQLANGPPVVLGAVMMDPILADEGVTGIVLNPDPHLLFQRLKEWVPAVKRIHVVHNPEQNAWLIDRARTAAMQHGLTLNAIATDSLQSGAAAYTKLVDEQMTGSDALWLLQDRTRLESRGLLPHIMRQAWNRELVVFSSSLAHVKRGALFALYPDNEGLGRSLAALALRRLTDKNNSKAGMLPLRDVKTAANLRTAEHLGISLTREQEADIDLAFPTR